MSGAKGSYFVRRPPPWRVSLPFVVAFGVLILLASPVGGLLPIGLPRLGWFFAVFAGIIQLLKLWQLSLVLGVTRRGVRLAGGASVPWPSVAAIVVARGRPGWVGVRLRPGAPLPRGVRGIVEDPADPSLVAAGLRRPIIGWVLDPHRLVRAVSLFGPHAAVVEVRDGRERPLRETLPG